MIPNVITDWIILYSAFAKDTWYLRGGYSEKDGNKQR